MKEIFDTEIMKQDSKLIKKLAYDLQTNLETRYKTNLFYL